MSQSPVDYLKHILDECEYILSAIPDGFTKEQLLMDETLKRAVVRSLEIIGEATKKLPDDLKNEWPAIQWKHIAGMRDKLIHDYFGINYSIVWDVIQNKIPELTDTVQQILKKEELS